MSVYLVYFKIKYLNEIQYRTAALAGIATQFAWGFMYIMLYTVFLNNSSDPILSINQAITYVWLQQAFFALFAFWSVDAQILNSIMTGNLVYELTKPISLYKSWFSKTFAMKIAKATLRAFPIFLICTLPILGRYRLLLPVSLEATFWFILTMFLSIILLISYIMIIYSLTITSISPTGVKITLSFLADFLSGAFIPIPFMPDMLQKILKLTPFYYFQNIPFNIYNGFISGRLHIFKIIGAQIFWIVILISLGKLIMDKSMKKVIIQGG